MKSPIKRSAAYATRLGLLKAISGNIQRFEFYIIEHTGPSPPLDSYPLLLSQISLFLFNPRLICRWWRWEFKASFSRSLVRAPFHPLVLLIFIPLDSIFRKVKCCSYVDYLTVVGCQKLKDTEWFSRQDPYVVLEYSGARHQTRTCTGSVHSCYFIKICSLSLIYDLFLFLVYRWWEKRSVSREVYVHVVWRH